MTEPADEFEDEFGPYLEEALKNDEFRDAYERAKVADDD